jgi:hypothetical protein
LGSSVKDYQENFFHTVAQQEWHCPICGMLLSHHGYYSRIVIGDDGPNLILIFRGRCEDCDKTHAILPDFIAPYRRYLMPVISQAVEIIMEEEIPPEQVSGPQDICTARRWHHRFSLICNEAIGFLTSIAVKTTGQMPTLIGNDLSSSWQLLKTALFALPSILSTSIMGAVNIWLTRDTVDLWL